MPASEEIPDGRHDRDQAFLRSHAAQISERFDTVQIICTTKDETGTRFAEDGEGNWYARYGSVREWIVREDAKTRKSVSPPETEI